MNALVAPRPLAYRPMTLEDIDVVLDIERRAYAFPWTRGNFRDCLESGYSCWVAEEGAVLVGYSILMIGVGEGHILNCCVVPERQGHGIGRRLMLRVIDALPELALNCLFLEVRPSNTAAINLYVSLGFETVGLRRHYYPAQDGREDALVMRFSR